MAVSLEGSVVALGVFGHTYQPPRECVLPDGSKMDLLPEINETIYNECYKPLFINEGLLPGEEEYLEQGIPDIFSFSFFAPLRAWMKVHHPEDFAILAQRIKEMPDKEWRVFGDPLIHAILPLQSPEEQDLLIKMGKEAFEKDFGFSPLGFWSPETAISTQTLELLHKNGYKFVILRDDQVFQSDHNPMYIKLPGGGEMAVFHFHKDGSGKVGYEDEFTRNADNYANNHVPRYADFFALGNDTETYGHHKRHAHKWVRRLSKIAHERNDYGIFSIRERLDEKERHYTQLQELSSWSCEHLMPDFSNMSPEKAQEERAKIAHMQLGRWKGTCNCGFDEHASPEVIARVNTEKHILYSESQRINRRINEQLDAIDPQWRRKYIEAVIAYHEKISMEINGEIITQKLSVQDAMFAGMDFFPMLQRAIAQAYNISLDRLVNDNMYGKLFSLFAGKEYAQGLLTSCIWFFADESSPERREGKRLLPAAESMLDNAQQIAA